MFCTSLEQVGFAITNDVDFPFRATNPNLLCGDEDHSRSTVIAHWNEDEEVPFFYCQKHQKALDPDEVLARAADGMYTMFVRRWPSWEALKDYPIWMWAEATKHRKAGMAITGVRSDGTEGQITYLFSHGADNCEIMSGAAEKSSELPTKGGIERHVSNKRDSEGFLRKWTREIMPLTTYSGLPEDWGHSSVAGSVIRPGIVMTYTSLPLVCLDFDQKSLPQPVVDYMEGGDDPDLSAVLQALKRNGAVFELSTSGNGLHAYFLASDIDVWRSLRMTLTPTSKRWAVDVYRGGRAGWVFTTEKWVYTTPAQLEQRLPVFTQDLLNQFPFFSDDFKQAANRTRPEKAWRPRPTELHQLLEERGWHLFIDEITDIPHIDTKDEAFQTNFYEERLYRSNAFHMAGIDPTSPIPFTEFHRAWIYARLVAEMNITLPQNHDRLFRDVAAMNPKRNLVVDYLMKCYKEYDPVEGFDYWVLPELYNLPEGHERHADIWRTAVRGIAQRILTPGSYVGTVVCLAGDIGLNKSALLQLMMPPARAPLAKKLSKELFQRNVYDRQKKMGEAFQGASLIEIEEVNTIFRSGYDQSEFMDQILLETATYRKSHRTDPQAYPMQAAYVGTLNLSREHEPFIPTNVPGYLRRLYIIFIEGERPKLPIREFREWWVQYRDTFWGAVMYDLLDLEMEYYPTTEIEKDLIIPETRRYTDLLGEPATEFLFERHLKGEIENYQRRELYDIYMESGEGKLARISAANFGKIIADLGYENRNDRFPSMENPDVKEQKRVYKFVKRTDKLAELEALYGATPEEFNREGMLTDAELDALGDE